MDSQRAVGRIALYPVGGGGFALGTTSGPDMFEGVGETAEEAQDGGRVGLANAALVLPAGHIQGMVSAVFDTPALLFQTQPFGLAQFLCGA